MNAVPAPITVTDLSVDADEPRIKDVRLGERLGMAQPLNIRQTIEVNRGELERYGSIHAAREMITAGKGASREVTSYHLNEPQALLLCMFSRTRRAADVRQEVIEVFMAYRRGRLAPTSPAPWERMNRRQAIVRQAVAFHVESKSPAFAEALAHLPAGAGRTFRLPDFWSDVEVRIALINLHRQVKIDEVVAVLIERFGPHRTPSRSAVHRFWQRLDAARGATRPIDEV